MNEQLKRSASQVNQSSTRGNQTLLIKPPTSPFIDNVKKERLYSPPIQHRRAIQPSSSSAISSSFTSLSSLNVQESIHTLLPKPPLSVTNRQSPSLLQANPTLVSADFSRGNIVQQIHQKLIQQRSLPIQERGANISYNGTANHEQQGNLKLVNNIRNSSPMLARRNINLSNSMNNNNSGNKLSNSASHNNSIDVVVNNPQENMQQDIVLSNEKEYLKSQLRQINEKQIFLTTSPLPVQQSSQGNYVVSPPQSIRITTKSDVQQFNSPISPQYNGIQQTTLMTSPTQTVYSPLQVQNSQISSQKFIPSAYQQTATFVKQNITNRTIQENQINQGSQVVKKQTANLSESALKLLDTYQKQKDILFENNLNQQPAQISNNTSKYQNDVIGGNSISQSIKSISQTNYRPALSTPNIIYPQQQTKIQYPSIPNQQNISRPVTSLVETQLNIQKPENMQPPLEKQRSCSQKNGLNQQTNSQVNAINYSSITSQLAPGSCALTKIISRPVTTKEEKDLIEEYKLKNNQRRNSFSSSGKSNTNQLPTVQEAALEQSMRLSSLLVNTSVFNQAKNSASQSRENSVESNSFQQNDVLAQNKQTFQDNTRKVSPQSNSESYQHQQSSWGNSLNGFREFGNQNQIMVYEDFDAEKESIALNEDLAVQTDFCQEQYEVTKEIIKTCRDEEQREVIKSAQTNYVEESDHNNQLSNNIDQTKQLEQEIPTKDEIIEEDINQFKKDYQNQKKESKYKDAQTSPIRTIKAKYSSQELNSLITDTNLFESKTLVESQFVITESSTVQNTQQNISDSNKNGVKLNTRHSDRIAPRNKDLKQEIVDEDYMKIRKKEIYQQIKEKKLNKKSNSGTTKTPRGNSNARQQKPSTPNNKQTANLQITEKIIAQNQSPQTKRESRISLDSLNLNMNNNNTQQNQLKQSKNSFDVSVSDSQTQSITSVQQLALQKRDEILDKIKHIDEQIIKHQKIQNMQKDDDISQLKQQNKMIIANSNLDSNINNAQSNIQNRSSHISQRSNVDDTPIKKIQQNSFQLQPSSDNNIQLPISQQPIINKNEKQQIKRSESNTSIRRQGSNKKIEGFVIQSNEVSLQQCNMSNPNTSVSTTAQVTAKNTQSQNYLNIGTNKFLNHFKDSFVNKNSKISDFSNDITQAQKQLMNKGYNKNYKQYTSAVSQPTSSRSTNNIKKKDLKISNFLDKSQESRQTCQSSTTANKNKHLKYDFLQKKQEGESIIDLSKSKNSLNFNNTKENLVNEPLGVINLFEIKNKKRDSSILNKHQQRDDVIYSQSPTQNHYFRVADKLKEYETKEFTLDSKKYNTQSRNRDQQSNTKGISMADYSATDYESKQSAKFNSVLQDMSNFHSDSKNIGFTLIPPTQELDLEAEHNKRLMKQNKIQEYNNNPYLLKKEEEVSFQEGKQNVQIKGNKYQFSFENNFDQEDKIPSCSFASKNYEGNGFAYDFSPIPAKNKVDDNLSEISHNYLQEQQEQLTQMQAKQFNRLEKLEEKLAKKKQQQNY
ncbi:hypothetical protein TTHERM_00684690 (macronuclear) [Tetrahymena thermophila SB210]|uniref:Uncharacterized protein n=1 Tax=Tetrahymena thermophila (strain SB210) TaxID=312017 RepID=I7MAN2_TETTS|nr:hypothetical protein TTHERM_00684690 [Tetrahymena thermophila SB210]EAS04925.2 hypothetical protein TTHERM_00684690 [Tetrahymena thermophila SB210]|eukprot:XP_001025170.2 hypothetical protein TTHERM_00684690 [Tetrahymena thermophila SB210]